jgi:hypothetical protein
VRDRAEGRESLDDPPKESPPQTPFSSILLYVFGFIVALAFLAFLTAWCLRR